MPSKTPDVVFVFATLLEAEAFLSLCPFDSQHKTVSGQSVYSGIVGPKIYDLLITGVGSFNSACALSSYLTQTIPKMIINAGISGVFKKSGYAVGDIGVATREQYLHTGVCQLEISCNEPLLNAPLPFDLIENYPDTRQGIYLLDEERASTMAGILATQIKKDPEISETCQAFCGPFLTVSAITSDIKNAARISEQTHCLMESMEGAACAHVATTYQIPFAQVRCASNYVGVRDKSQWDISGAVTTLGRILPKLFS